MSVSGDVTATLRAEDHGHPPCIVLEHHPNDSRLKISEDGVCQTLSTRMGTGGGNVPLVMMCGDNHMQSTFTENHYCDYRSCEQSNSIRAVGSTLGNGNVTIVVEDSMEYSMQAFGKYQKSDKASALKMRDYKDATDLVVGATCIGNGQADISSHITVELCQTLNCMHDQQAVCIGNGQINQISMAEQSNTLDTMHDHQAIIEGDKSMPSIVRRLTPLECTRLQGYPDGWVDIGEWTDSNGKLHKEADSPKYKALGNSIATPFWFWLLRRISAEYERPATLGSLFDGIGGFPYCHEKANGPGTAIWASEIEEFPIAVTKIRFPEEDE